MLKFMLYIHFPTINFFIKKIKRITALAQETESTSSVSFVFVICPHGWTQSPHPVSHLLQHKPLWEHWWQWSSGATLKISRRFLKAQHPYSSGAQLGTEFQPAQCCSVNHMSPRIQSWNKLIFSRHWDKEDGRALRDWPSLRDSALPLASPAQWLRAHCWPII